METSWAEGQPTILIGGQMTTLVQQFATYCEQNGMPSDDVGSAAFYANWRKIRTRQDLTVEEWNELLDFVSPYVPPTVCPIAAHHYG
jgi:hypothetical protein